MRRLWVPLGFAFIYLYAFPYFSALHSANEQPRVLLTEEIVEHHTFALDARAGELALGSTFDVATTPDGRHFSNKAPGASFLAVPAYLALKLFVAHPSPALVTWTFRIATATLPALLFLPFFFRLTRRFTDEDGPRRAALVAFGLGSMILPYGLLFYSHDLSAVCAGGAFVAAVWLARDEATRPRLTALGAGFLAGFAVLADYQSVIAALGVGLYLLIRSRHRLRDLALATLGTIPPAALLLLYHKVCFGSPWKTGYSFAADPAHKQGVLGVIGPNGKAMYQALLAPDNGLITLMPWVILALFGVWLVLRDPIWRARAGAEAIVCGGIAIAYVLFLGSLVPEFGRAGWSVGPRYIVVALPFFGWLSSAGLAAAERRPATRVLAHAAVLAAVVIFVVAATTYPHWPTVFRNPLYEVSFRALGSGLAPHSLGTAAGLHGFWSLLPLYVVVAALALALLGVGRRPATVAASVALAALLILGYSRFPVSHAPPEKWGFIAGEWEPK